MTFTVPSLATQPQPFYSDLTMTDEEFEPILKKMIADMEKELEGLVPFDDFDEEEMRKAFEVEFPDTAFRENNIDKQHEQ